MPGSRDRSVRHCAPDFLEASRFRGHRAMSDPRLGVVDPFGWVANHCVSAAMNADVSDQCTETQCEDGR
jgi:hypothetical protein